MKGERELGLDCAHTRDCARRIDARWIKRRNARLLCGVAERRLPPVSTVVSSILSATPSHHIGVANGIMAISRQLGIVSGYSVAGGLLAVSEPEEVRRPRSVHSLR